MAVGLAGRLAPNSWKPFGSASVGTAISSVWSPTAGKAISLMGFSLTLASGASLQVDLTDGTAAASSTVSTHYFVGSSPTIDFEFGAGKRFTVNKRLGIKARASAGTISGTFYGREV